LLRNVRGQKIKLEGFNNLTKTLSFNIYDICYAKSAASQLNYLEYIDEEYNSNTILNIIEKVTKIINAKLVNVSTQDYDPRGASVTALINEAPERHDIAGHLDKSHITVHTYPEHNKDTGIASFRADIEVSTCGEISPLNALNYLIENFESDIVIMDYRVRGFTRDSRGKKIFIDHNINSIQEYIYEDIINKYHAYDINIVSANIFHTKMMTKKIDLSHYLFGPEIEIQDIEKDKITKSLQKEIQEIFEGHNFN